MTFNNTLPVLIVLSALVPGLLIFFTTEQQYFLRRLINFIGNVSCLILIGLLLSGVYQGQIYETRLPLLPDIDLVLHADALSLLFVSLSGFLWLVTTVYAIGYLEGTKNRSRFFGFFSLCVAATLAIALAGNMITFLIFYELLTLTTYPLVMHKGNAASLRAGRIYLTYTMLGGALLLAGVVWLKALAGPLDFTVTGILADMQLDSFQLKVIFALLIAGLGVKAALIPFHGWLPVAMAAPAPVSALLHAVAVVKAGAFGIIRVTYDVYGIEYARDLGLTFFLALAAGLTIVYGSLRAVFQDDLKKRLAYSTVSQVSYIALGSAIAGPIATIGGMVHLVHQGVMKITLFFCAGNLAETVGIHKVSEMAGVGKRMPLTMTAFTVAALGMIGIPPIAGFVSKWYLGTGAVEVGAFWVLGVLAMSSLLNAIYFLPILNAVWFKPAVGTWPPKQGVLETRWMLLLPPLITASLALSFGLFAGASVSPLSWAQLIAAREYVYELTPSLAPSFASMRLAWVLILPLALSIVLLAKRAQSFVIFMAPWAALPALFFGLSQAVDSVHVQSLFFGSELVLDAQARVFLLLSAFLWLLGGIYGNHYLRNDAHLARYTLCFLLCMTGNFGLILSQDLFGFVAFFTLMSLSAYGFVVHSGTDEAMQAGRTYIQWVVLGELLLFAAFVGLALHRQVSTDLITAMQPAWISWLLLIGFGIKAGLLPMHVWLPRAHPVAPIPASALLSGLMVKAGLLGWWRFLPLGEASIPSMGTVLIALGMAGAFLAVLVGVTQRNPKAVLAYSTISQMGILAAGFGAGLSSPALWPVLSLALLVYIVHHGLAKAALFLSVGMAPALRGSSRLWRRYLWLLVALAAIAMAGFPFSNGALAKSALKSALDGYDQLVTLISFSAIGTTLLMLRFVVLLRQSAQDASQSALSLAPRVITFSLVVLAMFLIYALPQASSFIAYAFSFKTLVNALWPIAAGGLIFYIVQRYVKYRVFIPAGDLVVLIEKTAAYLRTLLMSSLIFISGSIKKSAAQLSLPDCFFSLNNSLGLRSSLFHPAVLFILLLACLFIVGYF